MIDASKGFIKDGNKNRLREQDIHRIEDTFTRQVAIPRYSRMVKVEEIADPKNDYNLNLPRYIDSTEPEDLQDIDAHLRGGIPERDLDAFAADWQQFPSVRPLLFESAGRSGYVRLKLPLAEVKPAILDHPEFHAFQQKVTKLFAKWRKALTPRLTGFGKNHHPKALIETVSETLLAAFQAAPLLDAYDVYQHLMDYYAETMQDDCYLIAADGWVAKTQRVIEEVKNGKKKGEMKDKGWACDLVPKPFIVARYFASEQSAIEAFQADLEMVNASLNELAEEHGGEEGALKDISTKTDAELAYTQALVALWNDEDKPACAAYSALIETAQGHDSDLRALSDHHYLSALKNPKGKLTLKAVKDRLSTPTAVEESEALSEYVYMDKKQKDATKEAGALFAKVESKFVARLSEDPLPESFRDLHATVCYLKLLDEQAALKAKVRDAEEALDLLAYEKYPQLTVDEIKLLVVDDKWMATIAAAVQGELDRVSQTLTGRIRQLAERYATPLPQLTDEVTELTGRVEEHLKKMGAVWK